MINGVPEYTTQNNNTTSVTTQAPITTQAQCPLGQLQRFISAAFTLAQQGLATVPAVIIVLPQIKALTFEPAKRRPSKAADEKPGEE